jgi:hypothetical protein
LTYNYEKLYTGKSRKYCKTDLLLVQPTRVTGRTNDFKLMQFNKNEAGKAINQPYAAYLSWLTCSKGIVKDVNDFYLAPDPDPTL